MLSLCCLIPVLLSQRLFFCFPLDNPQGKIRTPGYAKAAKVALYGLDRPGIPVGIGHEDIAAAQFNADAATLAPLVKNLKRNLGVFALFFLFRVFNFCLF
jgi:hypothetical protein